MEASEDPGLPDLVGWSEASGLDLILIRGRYNLSIGEKWPCLSHERSPLGAEWGRDWRGTGWLTR
jgi:hypothetical protein